MASSSDFSTLVVYGLIAAVLPFAEGFDLVALESCLTEHIFRPESRQYGQFTKYPLYGSKFNNSY